MSLLVPIHSRGEIAAYSEVDDSDAWIQAWRWRLSSHGYAACDRWTGKRYLKFAMHRVLVGLVHGDKRQVDHINRERLDNRRANLRVLTEAQQHQNIAARGAIPYRGVTFHKPTQRYYAKVKVDGKMVFHAAFATAEEAGWAAAEARASFQPFSLEALLSDGQGDPSSSPIAEQASTAARRPPLLGYAEAPVDRVDDPPQASSTAAVEQLSLEAA